MIHRIRRYWDFIFGLNSHRSIWIEQEDLGMEKVIEHKNKRYRVKIPKTINRKVVTQLRGLGRKRSNKTGDLLLRIWLNKGDDINKSLWLSEKSARNGVKKIILLDEKKIKMVIPQNSYDGLTIRLKGLGRKLGFNWRAPFLRRKRGNLLVKLHVYPDDIRPRYRPFESLATDDMVLEGWVYRKFDEVIQKIGGTSFPANPLQADTVADKFNYDGWRGIFQALVSHLELNYYNVRVRETDEISNPGSCLRTATSQDNGPTVISYLIQINEQFLDNPFLVTAILAHELCHVIYYEKIDPAAAKMYLFESEESVLEKERTVDLLVFMFKVGEFQLRVARNNRIVLGYLNQEVFERIQVIVSRRMTSP